MTFSLYITVYTHLIMCHFLCLYMYAQSSFPLGVSTVIAVCAFINICLGVSLYLHVCLSRCMNFVFSLSMFVSVYSSTV